LLVDVPAQDGKITSCDFCTTVLLVRSHFHAPGETSHRESGG
jgi:hypothetical protein